MAKKKAPKPRPVHRPPAPPPPYTPYPGYTQVGKTAHVTIYVADALGTKGVVLGKQLAAGLIEAVHNHVAWFFSKAVLIPISTTLLITGVGEGASHMGNSGSVISSSCTADFDPHAVAFLYACEAAEIFGATCQNWLSEWSHGEAMSRVVGDCMVPGYLKEYATVPYWINSDRADWVTQSKHSETDGPSIACGVCFLHYLHDQLQIAWPDITAAIGSSLEAKFRALTKRTGGFKEMCSVLDKKYPRGTPATLVGDNPFPIH